MKSWILLLGSDIVNVCSPISMNATALSPGSFSFSWSVSTDTANTTENSRVANYLNGLSDTSKVAIPVGYLLFKVNYTFKATILNSVGMPGSNRSISYLGLMCPISGGCLAPLFYSNGACISQCPNSSKVVTTSDSTLGVIQSCITGIDVSMSASTSKIFDQITIDFDQPILPFLPDPESQILITLTGYTITRGDNYSISVTSDSSMKVTFNFSVRIPAGTEAQVSFYTSYLPTLYQSLDMKNYHLKNVNCSLGLLEYYPFSATAVGIISVSSSMTTVGTATVNAMMAASQVANAGGNSFLLGAAFAAAMIQLNRFVNVSYPPNLLILYNNSLQTVIAMALPINLEDSTKNTKSSSDSNSHLRNLFSATDQTSEATSSNSHFRSINDGSKFALYEISPYFIINGISPLATIGLLVGILLLIRVLKRAKKCSVKIQRILRKIEEFLGWNFILTVVISSQLKISLYAALNLIYPEFQTWLGVTSFICSVIFVMLNILVIRYLVMAIYRNHSSTKKRKRDQTRALPSRTETNFARSYKILIEDYKSESVWQPLYVPLLLIRSMTISAALALFKSYGFPAALFLFCLSIVFFAYMIRHRPIKDKINCVLQIIFDAIIMIVSLSVFVLSIMDLRKVSGADTRMNIGWAITIMNYLIQGLSVLKVSALIGKLVYDKIVKSKKRSSPAPRLPTVTKSISDVNVSDASMIKKTPRANNFFRVQEQSVAREAI